MIVRKGVLVLGLAMSASVVIPGTPSAASGNDGTPKAGYGTIAFASNRDGDSEIYLMNADGSEPTRLTFSATSDSFPVLSPNGKQILWHTNRDGNFEIYVMNSDGTGTTRLTEAPLADTNADWSPNGKQIAFHSERDTGPSASDIYVMNADGTGQTRLTNAPGADRNPDWSPNGKHLLFNSDRDGNAEIYVMMLTAPTKPGSRPLPVTTPHRPGRPTAI